MKNGYAAILTLMIVVVSHQAVATSLCVRRMGIPNECFYDDPADCQREALRSGGECIVNPASPIQLTGSAEFCTVSGSTGICLYPDRPSCNAEASRSRSACVPNLPEANPPEDPYRQLRTY